MPQSLAHIALIVRNYDEAIAWFTEKLGFTLVADQHQPEQDKRWVLVAPPGAGENAATLLLARASTPEQEAFIGNQAASASSCSCTPTTSTATTKPSPPAVCASSALPPSSPTAQSRCSRTSTATSGTWCSPPEA